MLNKAFEQVHHHVLRSSISDYAAGIFGAGRNRHGHLACSRGGGDAAGGKVPGFRAARLDGV